MDHWLTMSQVEKLTSFPYFCVVGQETFNSKSLALQAQKKILSKMATMAGANLLTDDTSSELLDELYRASREYTKSKKEAHKIVKDVIKIAFKMASSTATSSLAQKSWKQWSASRRK